MTWNVTEMIPSLFVRIVTQYLNTVYLDLENVFINGRSGCKDVTKNVKCSSSYEHCQPPSAPPKKKKTALPPSMSPMFSINPLTYLDMLSWLHHFPLSKEWSLRCSLILTYRYSLAQVRCEKKYTLQSISYKLGDTLNIFISFYI